MKTTVFASIEAQMIIKPMVRASLDPQISETTTILATLTGAAGDLANGVVVFTFGSGDLNQSAGAYEGEIEVTFADSSVETVFEVVNFTLRADF